MIRVLVFGNSFGTDSTRYLNELSRLEGNEIRVVNLYIGGCSLYRHYRNMLTGEKAYDYEINGNVTGIKISLQEALCLEEWDYVLLHQASPQSGTYATYVPYLKELADFIHKYAPPAKIIMQMTWTFDRMCSRFSMTDFLTPEGMMGGLRSCYQKAKEEIQAEFLIPTGEAMWRLYQEKGAEIYRDGFHCNFGYTRYMISCMWYMALTGESLHHQDHFYNFDIPVSRQDQELVIQVATQTLKDQGFVLKD